MKTLIAVAALLLTMAPAQAQTGKPADLTGKWTGTFTRTAPDGQTQSINVMFDLVQKGKVLTGTVGARPGAVVLADYCTTEIWLSSNTKRPRY